MGGSAIAGPPFSFWLGDFFLAWWSGDFAGVFSEKRCFNVVFWWRKRGELRGGCGALQTTF